MLDPVVRGGTVVDCTGTARFTGDIGILHGRITAVGVVPAPAKQKIDAIGQFVTPGWTGLRAAKSEPDRQSRIVRRSCHRGDAR